MKTLKDVKKAMERVFTGEVSYTHDNEFNWFFQVDGESYKVRKDDCAVHYSTGNDNRWQYDFDLFKHV